MNPTHPSTDDDRLKLHEAISATALVAFAAFGLTVTFAALATRGVIVDAIGHLKKKGDNHVQ